MELATRAESQAIIYELGILSTGEDTVQALEPMAGRKRYEGSAWNAERRNKGPFAQDSTDGLSCLSVQALSSLFGSLTERLRPSLEIRPLRLGRRQLLQNPASCAPHGGEFRTLHHDLPAN